MAETLGKIEKPEAGQFKNKRKLLLVPLIFSGKGAPVDYLERFNLYWLQVGQQIGNLESGIGKVNRVYHELLTEAGEAGFKVLEELSPSSFQVAREKGENGAALESTEGKDLLDETLDWQRCLMMGFLSHKVAKMVSEFYADASRKRYEHIGRTIDETLKENEVGILFIREGHMVQFPQDMEVFSIAPPALNDLRRWEREQAEAIEKTGAGKEEEVSATDSKGEQPI